MAHLDLVVVTSRDEQRLLLVEADASHGSIVFVELLNECAHAVVPQLDEAVVKTRQHPWSFRVERKS